MADENALNEDRVREIVKEMMAQREKEIVQIMREELTPIPPRGSR